MKRSSGVERPAAGAGGGISAPPLRGAVDVLILSLSLAKAQREVTSSFSMNAPSDVYGRLDYLPVQGYHENLDDSCKKVKTTTPMTIELFMDWKLMEEYEEADKGTLGAKRTKNDSMSEPELFKADASGLDSDAEVYKVYERHEEPEDKDKQGSTPADMVLQFLLSPPIEKKMKINFEMTSGYWVTTTGSSRGTASSSHPTGNTKKSTQKSYVRKEICKRGSARKSVVSPMPTVVPTVPYADLKDLPNVTAADTENSDDDPDYSASVFDVEDENDEEQWFENIDFMDDLYTESESEGDDYDRDPDYIASSSQSD
ncbi:hypothetical protein ACP4OV_015760 [Aristida adscensionis]